MRTSITNYNMDIDHLDSLEEIRPLYNLEFTHENHS